MPDSNDQTRALVAKARLAIAEGRWTPQQTDDDPTKALDNLERLLADPAAKIYEIDHWNQRLAESWHDATVYGTYRD